jgi:predicted AAA+ superfamily ATPase
MNNAALYYEYNPWWENTLNLENVIFRPIFQQRLERYVEDKSVVFLSGLRRVGKTTLLKLLVHSLLAKGVLAKHLFFISLDDYALRSLSIGEIVQEYRTLHRLKTEEKIYLFLDEVAYQENFRQQLKNLYDRTSVKIFAASSNASALRDQKGFLTGREGLVEILPLSFEEFLVFRGIDIKQRDAHLKESYFEEYLQTGGMPEYVLTRDRGYLTALIEDILYKDIVAFHGIKQPEKIKDCFVLLMERAGKQVSLNKMAHILNISPDTARRYLALFEETFLVHLIPRFGKTNERLLAPRKLYAADLGMRNLITGFRDKGAVFENFVFLQIKSLHPCYIYQNSLEIDFYTENQWLIEVKYNHPIGDKQKALFDILPAKQKWLIDSYQSWEEFSKQLTQLKTRTG